MGNMLRITFVVLIIFMIVNLVVLNDKVKDLDDRIDVLEEQWDKDRT